MALSTNDDERIGTAFVACQFSSACHDAAMEGRPTSRLAGNEALAGAASRDDSDTRRDRNRRGWRGWRMSTPEKRCRAGIALAAQLGVTVATEKQRNRCLPPELLPVFPRSSGDGLGRTSRGRWPPAGGPGALAAPARPPGDGAADKSQRRTRLLGPPGLRRGTRLATRRATAVSALLRVWSLRYGSPAVACRLPPEDRAREAFEGARSKNTNEFGRNAAGHRKGGLQ